MHDGSLEISRLEPFGAEIRGVDLSTELPEDVKNAIRTAWYEEGVVVFNQPGLTEDDLDRISLIFGNWSNAGIKEVTASSHRQYISNVIPERRERTGNGVLHFHMGFSFAEHPLRATMLYGIEVPPPDTGGDTLFANAKLAYQALPAKLREKVGRLSIRHTQPQDKTATWTHPIAFPHPVTGETVLFCSPRHFTEIPGMDAAEGQALCDELGEYLKDEAGIYTHKWREGDLVVWDNIKLQHARTDFDPNHRRHLGRRQMGPLEPVPA